MDQPAPLGQEQALTGPKPSSAVGFLVCCGLFTAAAVLLEPSRLGMCEMDVSVAPVGKLAVHESN